MKHLLHSLLYLACGGGALVFSVWVLAQFSFIDVSAFASGASSPPSQNSSPAPNSPSSKLPIAPPSPQGKGGVNASAGSLPEGGGSIEASAGSSPSPPPSSSKLPIAPPPLGGGVGGVGSNPPGVQNPPGEESAKNQAAHKPAVQRGLSSTGSGDNKDGDDIPPPPTAAAAPEPPGAVPLPPGAVPQQPGALPQQPGAAPPHAGAVEGAQVSQPEPGEGDDKSLNDTQKLRGKLETLQNILQSSYDPDPQGRDPFKSFRRKGVQGPQIILTPAEKHPLKDMKLIGIKWGLGVTAPTAMFRDPEGQIFRLRKNDRIGRSRGIIYLIREDEVVIVQPESSGTAQQDINYLPIVISLRRVPKAAAGNSSDHSASDSVSAVSASTSASVSAPSSPPPSH